MLSSAEQVHLSVREARLLGLRALRKIGIGGEDAEIVVDHLIDAGLCGYRFASLPRILTIAAAMRDKPVPGPIRIVRQTPVSAVLDGANNCGYIAVYRATEVAIQKAQENGFAVVGVYNSYYSGRSAYYLEMIARKDLVGIHVAGGIPVVAPLGGTRAVFGTNPIAFGLPTDDGPFIFDMGTSAVMWGEVRLLARLGIPLPEGCALDAEGRPTTDAAQALSGAALPFGGYKGFGLALVVQALALLAGMHEARGSVQDYGFLHIVFNPSLTVPIVEFRHQVAELLRIVKMSARQPGVAEIRIPGERAARERERRWRTGLDFDKQVIEALERL